MKAISLLLILVFMAPILVESRDGPKIAFEERSYDFGTVDQEQVVTHTFRFRNASEETLKVGELGTDCGCTEASVSSKVIPPRGSGELSAVFETGLRLGHFTSGVTVHSNDPQDPVVHLTVTGIIGADVEVRPGNVDFGDVKPEMSAIKTVEIISRGKDALSITKLSASSPFLTAEIVRRSSRIVSVQVALRPGLPVGRIDGHLRLYIQGREKPLLIPIVGWVLPKIRVEPASLSLGTILEGKRRGCILRVVYNKPGVKVTALQKDLLFLAVRKVKGGDMWEEYEVVVQNDGHVPGGQFRDKLKLLTNDPGQPVIEVPISGLALKRK